MNLESKIEALLFYKNEPIAIKELARILAAPENEVREAAINLAVSLKDRGICLIANIDQIALATNPVLNDLIEKVAKDELSQEISKASLETLAIILYSGPISRREIDHIRGVNSTFTLRNLAMRGLIEKEESANNQRIIKYKATLALYAHLGITKKEELPDFADFQKSITDLDNQTENGE